MIVDDYHSLVTVLSSEAVGDTEPRPPLYLDARVPTVMHLRLLSALAKPGSGRLTRALHAGAPDPAHRSALLNLLSDPHPDTLIVLDDRPLASAIAALTTEPGTSIAFAALIAHAVNSGQPILIDPANEGRWMEAAEARRVEVVSRPALVR